MSPLVNNKKRLCECGKPSASMHTTDCNECRNRKDHESIAAKEFQRYSKATKIKQSDWTGEQCFFGDEFFEDVTDAVEAAEADGGSTPEYVWNCKKVGLPVLDIDVVLCHILENMWEDAGVNDLLGTKELEAALDNFNAANKGIIVWHVDYSTAILVEQLPQGDHL